MTRPQVTAVRLGGSPRLPLLVLGPSLGTSATTLWSRSAARLSHDFEVLAWDLPGHGTNTGTSEPFTIAELAAAVLDLVDDMLAERGQDATFCYVGNSVGGAVGLQMLLDAPARIDAAVLVCTGAKIGEAEGWADRAATVRRSGTPSMVEGSAGRWFAPGFLDREPEVGSALLHALADADSEGYAQVCEALAGFDVRGRLGKIGTPVLAVAGAHDAVTPPSSLSEIVDGVADGHLVVVPEAAHLLPAECPARLHELTVRFLRGERPDRATAATRREVRDAGMAVRREVLGDVHVNRAVAATTDFTADFQAFITEYAWGSVWTRPGLDRRSRSMITLTALVARGHHEELAMHVRAARTNGLSNDEIKELLLQTAIYCGVPDANTAFRIAQRVLAELDDPDQPGA